MAVPSIDPRFQANKERDTYQEEKIDGRTLANEGIKISKEKAGFRKDQGVGERNCGVCRFYEEGVCEVVEGVVTPNDISNLFQPMLSRGNVNAMQAVDQERVPTSSVKKQMYITRITTDSQSGVRRWFATASGIKRDQYDERMSVRLFQDFIDRIENQETPPPPYSSDYWSGGLPYLSVAHYLDLNGEGSVGMAERVWYDGSILKAKGIFLDTPMADKVYEAIDNDIKNNVPDDERVRISIAFLDHGHEHEGHGQFTRRAVTDKCEMCAEGIGDKIYQLGHLIHLAATRIPAYKETEIHVVERNMTKEERNIKKLDAQSIVGEEFADELEKKTNELMVGRSDADAGEALVIKSDDEEDYEDEDKDKDKEEMEEKSEKTTTGSSKADMKKIGKEGEEKDDDEEAKKKDMKRLAEANKSLATLGGAKTLEDAEVFLSRNAELVATPLDALVTVLTNATGMEAEQAEVARSVLADYQNSLNVQAAEALSSVQQFLEGGQPMTEKTDKVAVKKTATEEAVPADVGVEEGVQTEELEGLPAVLASFQARVAEAEAVEGATPEDILVALQEPFQQFTEEVAAELRSHFLPEVNSGDGNGGFDPDVVRSLIQEELAPLLAALQGQKAETQEVPEQATIKRALQPRQPIANVVEKNAVATNSVMAQPTPEKPKPGSLTDVIRRSVGIPQGQ